MDYLKKRISGTDRFLQVMMRTICIVSFTILFILLAGNVLIRNFPVMEIYWFDEVVEFAFAWLVFIGVAQLWATNDHFRLDWFSERIKNQKVRRLFLTGIEVVCLIFLLIFTYQSLQLTILAKDWTPVFNIPKRFLYVCMPISGSIMVGYSIRAIVYECRQIRIGSKTT